MPSGPGTYGPGAARGSGLAGQALARQGVPQGGVAPGGAGGAPDSQTIAQVLQMLKGGQVGAEKLMQLLAVLAQSTMGQGGQPGASRQERPRRQGRDRQRGAGQRGAGQRGANPAQQMQAGGAGPSANSIRGLLG